MAIQKNYQVATLAGGCFWCTEAIFKRLKGVTSVMSGYANSRVENPSYEAVCSGQTGAAEAIQIMFDPSVISYEVLLDVFFATHDPTTMNKQGVDVGIQYRSAIFYKTDLQMQVVEKKIAELNQIGKFKSAIVTEVIALSNFYEAEQHHQDFYDNNRGYGYCQVVIDPKVKKLLSEYKDIVKKE